MSIEINDTIYMYTGTILHMDRFMNMPVLIQAVSVAVEHAVSPASCSVPKTTLPYPLPHILAAPASQNSRRQVSYCIR